MGLKICSLASGSGGNCIYIASDKTSIIIDMGVPLSIVEKAVKLFRIDKSSLSILVTHTHSDHIKELPSFMRKNPAMLYAHYRSAEVLQKKCILSQKNFCELGEEDIIIGDITVTPFEVSHDVPCVGYSFFHKGKKISLCTDLGCIGNSVMRKLEGSDVVMIESNHDEGLVRANNKIPEFLKKRILSARGHLSNTACAEAVARLAKTGVKQFLLAHISKDNNYPELAFSSAEQELIAAGFEVGKEVFLEIALQDKLSGLFEVS